MTDTLLVRYGELALKSPPVRHQFEYQLKRNLLDAFLQEKRQCTLSADHGHLYVHTPAAETALHLVRRVFGVVSVSAAEVVPSKLEEIERCVLATADPLLHRGASFAVRARRTGSHPFTSQSLGARLGEVVLERFADRDLHVDLDEPDVELHVEVRGPQTYVYIDRTAGPGGLPLGVGGKVGALIDGPRGALGAYMMMKRGCRVVPAVLGPGAEIARAVLARFDPKLAPFDVASVEEGWRELKGLAERRGLDGVALPLEVEEYPPARTFFGETVIFSPTVGLDDQGVAERWSAAAALVQ